MPKRKRKDSEEDDLPSRNVIEVFDEPGFSHFCIHCYNFDDIAKSRKWKKEFKPGNPTRAVVYKPTKEQPWGRWYGAGTCWQNMPSAMRDFCSSENFFKV
jgi:hypothetical protein